MKSSTPIFFAGLLVLAGCATSPPSLVIVHVEAESGVQVMSGSYTLRVEGRAPGGEFSEEFRETHQSWGRDFTLGPREHDASRSYRVTLIAYEGRNGDGEPVVQNVLISGYVQGQTRRYELVLYDACQGRVCGENLRCDSMGECLPAEVPAINLPPFDAGDGGVLDSGQDGNVPDASEFEECDSQAIAQVSVGDEFSCALTEIGAVYCWGRNNRGQIVPGGVTQPQPPTLVNVPGMVSEIQAGAEHACALTSLGAVYCWGYNHTGIANRLGTDDDTNPYQTIESGAQDLSVGGWHSCAAMGNGSVRCWGTNQSGELGRTNARDNNNNVVGGTSPGFTEATQVLAGFGNSCASLGNDGGLWCWGYDGNEAVGQPAGGDDQWVHRQVEVPDLRFDIVTALSASHTITPIPCGTQNNNTLGGTTCGVFRDATDSERLYCWGSNGCGQVGNGATGRTPTPEPVNAGRFPAGSHDWILAVGGGTVCAASRVTDEGPRPLYCWGDSSNNKLLDSEANIIDASLALQVMRNVTNVSVGMSHLCAVSGRHVYCWGDNSSNQILFDNEVGEVSTPTCVPIPGL